MTNNQFQVLLCPVQIYVKYLSFVTTKYYQRAYFFKILTNIK